MLAELLPDATILIVVCLFVCLFIDYIYVQTYVDHLKVRMKRSGSVCFPAAPHSILGQIQVILIFQESRQMQSNQRPC